MKKKQFTRFMTTVVYNCQEFHIIVTRDGNHFELHLKQVIGEHEIDRNFNLCFCLKSLDYRLKEYKRVKRAIFEECSCRWKKSN